MCQTSMHYGLSDIEKCTKLDFHLNGKGHVFCGTLGILSGWERRFEVKSMFAQGFVCIAMSAMPPGSISAAKLR